MSFHLTDIYIYNTAENHILFVNVLLKINACVLFTQYQCHRVNLPHSRIIPRKIYYIEYLLRIVKLTSYCQVFQILQNGSVNFVINAKHMLVLLFNHNRIQLMVYDN